MFHTDDAVIAALAEPLDDRLIVDLARPRLEPPGIVPDLDVGNLVPATVERRDQVPGLDLRMIEIGAHLHTGAVDALGDQIALRYRPPENVEIGKASCRERR